MPDSSEKKEKEVKDPNIGKKVTFKARGTRKEITGIVREKRGEFYRIQFSSEMFTYDPKTRGFIGRDPRTTPDLINAYGKELK